MADTQLEKEADGQECVDSTDTTHKVGSVKQPPKRCSSGSPTTASPHKSLCTDVPSSASHTPDTVDRQELQTESTEGHDSPLRRKSWRRETKSRHSLPALSNPYQILCRNISPSLSQQERLEKLMEASMRLAIDRTENCLQSVPNASLELFQKQVECIHKEWACVAKNIQSEPHDQQLHATTSGSSDPAVQKSMEKMQKAIDRLQAESESWEALLSKHRDKAVELERKMEQGQERGVALDSTCVSQSSQYQFLQNKPDYQGVLCRQQPILHTITMIMDTQFKIVRELRSLAEQSQLCMKETSGRLAAEAGFQALSPDIRNLMDVPLSSGAT
ncbi:uncharacterized protein LOC117527566 isoform X2 [Thalassophryne amazonica]|uniref:uncharacterized protein LOC117527566 isoform X2 n=1 Tax=Thalassophryne amazonica TaxID=390379 RepID=UPI0014718132|nr:uncharacterized protein LOC117527566 isoform X2 [Thalassophryne amazonica]